MFNSRMQQPFARLCRVRPRCWQPKVACNQLTTDLEAARRLSIKFPGSITVLRYEDLSLEPEKMAKLVMNFLDLPWTESMANFIASHTSQEQFLLGRNKSLVKGQHYWSEILLIFSPRSRTPLAPSRILLQLRWSGKSRCPCRK